MIQKGSVITGLQVIYSITACVICAPLSHTVDVTFFLP